MIINQSYIVPIVGLSLFPLWKSRRPLIVNVEPFKLLVIVPIQISGLIRLTAIYEVVVLRLVNEAPTLIFKISSYLARLVLSLGSMIFIL